MGGVPDQYRDCYCGCWDGNRLESLVSGTTPFTPSDEGIRNCYVYSKEMYDGSLAVPEYVSNAEFNRWMAAHDADVTRKALESAADEMPWVDAAGAIWDEKTNEYIEVPDWLRNRAAGVPTDG